ncbi:MAG TPA: hypothetical protein VGW75_13525 [Solirubrobacteraceae bacterium]|jgi:hypothetical protein|nr:hypothetical protein [Solirubrobacteraceae bacterium]
MPRHAAIAVGAALLATALVAVAVRMEDPWSAEGHLAVAAVGAAVLLAAGLRERPAGGRPSAGTSGLLLGGLVAFAIADLRFLQALGGDDALETPRSLTAYFALLTAVALVAAWRSRSAACLLVGALAAGGTLLAAVRWVFDTENVASYRPAVLFLVLAFAVAARFARGRHRDVLADAAGLAVLALAFLGGGLFGIVGGGGLPDAWEAVVLAGAVGVVAYTALTRAPGPAVIAIVVLAAFASTAGAGEREIALDAVEDPSLVGWPIVLGVAGLAALAFGLTRPRDPDEAPEDRADVSREVRL